MLKNRLIVLAVLLLSVILIGFRGGTAYLLFYTALFLPLLSAAYLFYVYFRFRIYQYIDHKTIVKGEQVPYEFILANEDVIAYTYVNVLFLQDTSSVDDADLACCRHLLPGESVRQESSITCRYRGIYNAGISRVEIRDFFQLFRLVYPIATPIQVKVLPRIVHLKSFLPVQNTPDDRLPTMRQTLMPALLDTEVRPYLPGDSLRQINWKATASKMKPFSRTYMEEPRSGLIVICDFTKHPGTDLDCLVAEDKLIETAVAAADYLLNNSLEAVFAYDTGEPRLLRLKSRRDFDLFYQACSDTAFEAVHSASSLLLCAAEGALAEGIALLRFLILTQDLSPELGMSCHQALTKGHEVGIICIGKGEKKEYLAKLDERITFFLIHPGQNIEEVLCV